MRRGVGQVGLVLDFLEIFLEVLPFLGLLPLQKLFLLPFLDAFLIALHDDGDEDVLDGSVEKDHEEDEVELPGQALGPGLEEGVVDNIAVEEGEESDDGGAGVLEFVVLPEDGLAQEDEPQEKWHHSQQEHQQVAPGFAQGGRH